MSDRLCEAGTKQRSLEHKLETQLIFFIYILLWLVNRGAVFSYIRFCFNVPIVCVCCSKREQNMVYMYAVYDFV